MEAVSKKKQLIKHFLDRDLLLSAELLDDPRSLDIVEDKADELSSRDLLVLNNDLARLLKDKISGEVNWVEYDKSRVLYEKNKDPKVRSMFLDLIRSEDKSEFNKDSGRVRVLDDYHTEPIKRTVQHFVSYFNARFKQLEAILRNRQELSAATSISRVLGKREQETVSIIGIVSDRSVTRNGNIILELEDPTAKMKVIVSRSKQDVYETALDVVNDTVIGITGMNKDKVIFANSVVLPDVPLVRDFKKSPDEAHAVFISDIHVGSNNFMEAEFNRFLDWISMDVGSDKQKELARKVKYLFVVGDLVDGVGIYPNQEKELVIPDVYNQYERFAEYISRVPRDVNIIICPGNHDAVRLAEPQPGFSPEVKEIFSSLPNITLVSNPSMVNIHSSDGFPGFDVLMYHGYSFDHYVANVDTIRKGGGYDRADLIMKFMLQKRHLAPEHASTLYIPDAKRDALVIDKVPDMFCTGHIHKTSVSHYRGVTLISGSCWQKTTDFQVKVGHHPEPARVPIVDLRSREIKILKF